MITLNTMRALTESASYDPYACVSMEDFSAIIESTTVTTLNEGIGHNIWETIKDLWGRLVNLVSGLINKIKGFFAKIFKRGRESADDLKAKADKIPDDAKINEDKATGKADSSPAPAEPEEEKHEEPAPEPAKPEPAPQKQEAPKAAEPKKAAPVKKPAPSENYSSFKVANDIIFKLASSNAPLTDAVVGAVISASSNADVDTVKNATQNLNYIKDDNAIKSWTEKYAAVAAANVDMSSAKIRDVAGFRKVDNDWVLDVFKAKKGVPKSGRQLKSMIHDFDDNTKTGTTSLGDAINKYCGQMQAEYTKTQKMADDAYRAFSNRAPEADPGPVANMYKAQAGACGKALSVVTKLCSAYCDNIRNVINHNNMCLNNFINAVEVSDNQKAGMRKVLNSK